MPCLGLLLNNKEERTVVPTNTALEHENEGYNQRAVRVIMYGIVMQNRYEKMVFLDTG